MKNKFKGFTLVECLIALAILGVATMVMAQIYAGVSKINKNNHEVNTSISNQMQFVEKQLDDGGLINIEFNNGAVDPELEKDADGNYTGSQQPPHAHISNNGGTDAYILLTEIERDADGNITSYGNKFSYPVDISVLKIRDREGDYAGEGDFDENYEAIGDGAGGSNTGPKYKYFTAH